MIKMIDRGDRFLFFITQPSDATMPEVSVVETDTDMGPLLGVWGYSSRWGRLAWLDPMSDLDCMSDQVLAEYLGL